VFTALSIAHAAPPPPRILGSCNPTKTKFALSVRGTTANANGVLVNVNEGAFAFTQTARGCVLVDFSAFLQVTDAAQDSVIVQATLTAGSGGPVLGRPSNALFQPANNNADTRAAEFVFADVMPGTYTVRLQMSGSAATTSDTVMVNDPNIVVHYN
jgi:hypothetical protein